MSSEGKARRPAELYCRVCERMYVYTGYAYIAADYAALSVRSWGRENGGSYYVYKYVCKRCKSTLMYWPSTYKPS